MTDMYKKVNGERVLLSEEEKANLEAEWKANEEKSAKTKHIKNRQLAYPSIQDQLDTIYHRGLDAWIADIAAVKARYPKPKE